MSEKVIYTFGAETLKETPKETSTQMSMQIPMEIRRKLAWLFEGHIFYLFISNGITFEYTENNSLYGKWNGIKIYIRDYSDALALFQFAYDYYDFSILNKFQDVTVLEIGAHIGISTNYFSKHPSISKVYSYEPFKENYEQLLLNLNLNPDIPKKATVENTGVSDEFMKTTLLFYPNASLFSGRLSDAVRNINNFLDYSNSYESTCTLKNINSIIANISSNNTILIFINAVGLEEKILRRLFSSDSSDEKIDISRICAVVGNFYSDFGIDQLFIDNGFDFNYHPNTISLAMKKFGIFNAINTRNIL